MMIMKMTVTRNKDEDRDNETATTSAITTTATSTTTTTTRGRAVVQWLPHWLPGIGGCGFDPAHYHVLAIRRLSPPPRWVGLAADNPPKRIC